MNTRLAFTMVELVFVIVVIGILSAIAIPKLAATRDDATITVAINTVSSVRSALATERQKRVLRGTFTDILGLSANTGNSAEIFEEFMEDDGASGLNPTGEDVLEYPLTSCEDADAVGCWITNDGFIYTYRMPVTGTVDFNITNNRFVCDDNDA
ncbi:MAG TPA: prepilin-type N-terminal cleavage/methylation domain-containing protein, partial [Helicobacteraceae bacterium]|nr:prepilin-type N-terminal cleavage/methylation domain-containing protein [Helicobacteraceae bacterium]